MSESREAQEGRCGWTGIWVGKGTVDRQPREGRYGWTGIWSCMWYEQAPQGKPLFWCPDAPSGLLGSLQMVPCDLKDKGVRSSDLPRQLGTTSPLRKTSHVRRQHLLFRKGNAWCSYPWFLSGHFWVVSKKPTSK